MEPAGLLPATGDAGCRLPGSAPWGAAGLPALPLIRPGRRGHGRPRRAAAGWSPRVARSLRAQEGELPNVGVGSGGAEADVVDTGRAQRSEASATE